MIRNRRRTLSRQPALPALPGWGTIRGRVAIVLAVPTCLLLVVTGLGVVDRAADWSAARETAGRVELVLKAQDLVRELQRERGLTNGLVGGAKEYRDDVDVQRARTDTARTGFDALLAAGGAGADTADDLRDVLSPVSALADVRQTVDDGAAQRAPTLAAYTEAIDGLISAAAAEPARGDRPLADAMGALQALARTTEAVALERGSLNGVFAAGRFKGSEFLDFTEVRAERLAFLRQYAELATSDQQSALAAAFATSDARRATGYEKRAEGGADGSRLAVNPGLWWSSMTVLVDQLHRVQRQIGADVRVRADRVGDDATRQLGGFIGLGVLILAVATALAVLSARSITRPLVALADEADSVARTGLPAAVARIQEAEAGDELVPEPSRPVPDSAREFTRLATALHNVEHTAIGLATEQAVLRRNTSESLASLGRRNQALLSRQLGLITILERQEVDPDALGELFELDHLATRMRRNAESLLVLAGEELPPRTWSGLVTAAEVVQSAIAEVEQYQRVAVADVQDGRIRGRAVAELSHLLAELIENALVFSPPSCPVEIYGWRDVGDYCLAVVDRGSGMSAEELARSNARLAGRETFLIAPTRYLGHYVVGTLAARLGAQVELRPTQGQDGAVGVTAYIALPATLVDVTQPQSAQTHSAQTHSATAG
ncbi:nitrate- and nitrite sensing domain-containing protein [Streptomyces lunaelactis]|uniref:sensor histidine kinase n=1 Tax=Streptomyces lunaelactis TaxID=1535768 RepID=UPI00158496AF|nr:nitrate- and nitrite sensing domain-containing protein [Streptomyces lunaelactis]NUK34928.1 nitrate- and nitrite sensing domain-containing protein [Streptomyces lunaelactis]NUK41686.1 nitrate- and nitrite sensing domain-containing protein [Streptomyces lunaelactis]NUK92050.1 nitrate- and nitrite sensing domain-containing protein [Streptomyces lunaelactis]NUL29598.1 nitrate- and nitrite sensing domain-containing protein [Streptomyces lunaelactis]